eukprot:793803-Rhodomonas_salina.1
MPHCQGVQRGGERRLGKAKPCARTMQEKKAANRDSRCMRAPVFCAGKKRVSRPLFSFHEQQRPAVAK